MRSEDTSLSHSHGRKLSMSKSKHGSSSRHRSARDLADEELQRAIELSLKEVNGASSSAHHEHGPRRVGFVAPAYEPPLVEHQPGAAEEDDPEMRAAIEASLREANAPRASAPLEAMEVHASRQWTS